MEPPRPEPSPSEPPDPRSPAEAHPGDGGEPLVRLRGDAVDWREVDGQVVVLDRAGSVYLAVNGTGAVLWPAVVEGSTRADLVRILLETFDVEPSRAQADVDAFVGSLSERNLLDR